MPVIDAVVAGPVPFTVNTVGEEVTVQFPTDGKPEKLTVAVAVVQVG